MRIPAVIAAIMLASCSAEQIAEPALPKSACHSERFEDSGFVVCEPASAAKLTLVAARSDQPPKRRFRELGLAESKVAFAMNAGMFDEGGRPIGLTVSNGEQLHKINLRSGGGNFGLKPNGIFLVHHDGSANIIVSEDYAKERDVALATQSGPMLVIDGKLHPKFQSNGQSQNMRNAVGMTPGGKPVFVMTEDPVSLGKLARFFRDRLKAKQALYLDGSISSLWDPANGRMDNFTKLGPILVAAK